MFPINGGFKSNKQMIMMMIHSNDNDSDSDSELQRELQEKGILQIIAFVHNVHFLMISVLFGIVLICRPILCAQRANIRKLLSQNAKLI